METAPNKSATKLPTAQPSRTKWLQSPTSGPKEAQNAHKRCRHLVCLFVVFRWGGFVSLCAFLWSLWLSLLPYCIPVVTLSVIVVILCDSSDRLANPKCYVKSHRGLLLLQYSFRDRAGFGTSCWRTPPPPLRHLSVVVLEQQQQQPAGASALSSYRQLSLQHRSQTTRQKQGEKDF